MQRQDKLLAAKDSELSNVKNQSNKIIRKLHSREAELRDTKMKNDEIIRNLEEQNFRNSEIIQEQEYFIDATDVELRDTRMKTDEIIRKLEEEIPAGIEKCL